MEGSDRCHIPGSISIINKTTQDVAQGSAAISSTSRDLAELAQSLMDMSRLEV